MHSGAAVAIPHFIGVGSFIASHFRVRYAICLELKLIDVPCNRGEGYLTPFGGPILQQLLVDDRRRQSGILPFEILDLLGHVGIKLSGRAVIVALFGHQTIKAMFSVIVVPPLQRDGRDGGVGPSGGSVDLICGVSKKRLIAEGILGDPT